MSDDKTAFSIPSDEQVLEAGSRVRKVTVNMVDTFEFEAESLADAIAGADYVKRIVALQADRERRELVDEGEGGDHVGPHGPGCNCDEILEKLFGGDVARSVIEKIRKAGRQHREKGN